QVTAPQHRPLVGVRRPFHPFERTRFLCGLAQVRRLIREVISPVTVRVEQLPDLARMELDTLAMTRADGSHEKNGRGPQREQVVRVAVPATLRHRLLEQGGIAFPLQLLERLLEPADPLLQLLLTRHRISPNQSNSRPSTRTLRALPAVRPNRDRTRSSM